MKRKNIMKNKAFTLIELLAVIVILAIIALIAVPIVLNIIGNAKSSSIQRSKELYLHAVEIAISNRNLSEDFNPSICTVKSDGNLNCDAGYLEVETTGKRPTGGTIEIVDYDIVKADLDFEDMNNNIEPTAEGPYLYGLTPVIYENNNWKVADTSKNWYDYKNQEWANAVVLNDNISKNVGEIIDVTSEIKAMFVWIPRYEYKIEGQYGKGGTNPNSPGEIEIKFVSRNTTESSDGYRIHPAFQFGTINLAGFWVGKFETTGTEENPTILPNITSLRNQNVSTQFETAGKFESYLDTDRQLVDSHMAKNSEWAAVAYLSQSKYGKYGNSMYTKENKQIYINTPDGEYITGRISLSTPGNISRKTSRATDDSAGLSVCSYNSITDVGSGYGSCGGGGSTTGNITGVYDMNGGSFEYVMGYVSNSNKWGANGTGFDFTGFTSKPDEEYFDSYTNTGLDTACNGGICYGHALSETKNWYGEFIYQTSNSTSWLIRGNYPTGVFHPAYENGDANEAGSFRVVISPYNPFDLLQ